ncbi:MAG: ferrous iron transport protein A [Niabella sp.]
MDKNTPLLLSELKKGQKAKITKFSSEDIFLKLMEMGCLPGEQIEVLKIAPLNDPISISVAGYTLSLRVEEARNIEVEVLP